ncbi:HEXXH motif domain-containing protein [Saccharothrix mutabilis subsp. mutabilis]|uniref:HEXXH motif domain-containing protein n=1 Tax=Saccharothrix mutabilis subsp. mutabilis TaxID=66855 RepID=A0ABN0UV73_9PSEU
MPALSRMPRPTFDALARGGGGPAAVRLLVGARRSRTLQLIRHIADRSAVARRALEVVKTLPAAAVHRVVDHPAVGEWATRTAIGRGSPAGLAFVAAAAAVRARASVVVDLPRSGTASLPTLGRLEGHPHGRVAVDGLTWRPAPEVVVPDGPTFALEHWPDGGPPTRLPLTAEFDVGRWQDTITAAWSVLTRAHGEVAAELAAAITVLTPLATPGVNSATHADAFGCVFLSLPHDPESAALTLAHELQHTKLVALMDLFPLVRKDSGQRFYAPWRTDPRPAIGLLHGAYAHLGVAGFCLRAGRETEFARWRRAALDVSNTLLAGAALTDTGRDFVQCMATTLEQWCTIKVSPSAQHEADHLAATHRTRWRAANPGD